MIELMPGVALIIDFKTVWIFIKYGSCQRLEKLIIDYRGSRHKAEGS